MIDKHFWFFPPPFVQIFRNTIYMFQQYGSEVHVQH